MRIPRATLRLLVLFLGGGFLFALLAHFVDKSLVVGVFVVWAVSAVLYLRMRCPHCRNLLGKQRLKKVPWPFPVWGLPLSGRCPHCGKIVP